MEVYVTGLGVVSALGIGAEANFDALKTLKTGIKLNTLMDGLFEDTFVGELSLSNTALEKLANVSHALEIPRTALLGIIAAREALGNTSLDQTVRTGFINGSTVGGMDLSENYFRDIYLHDDHQMFGTLATHDLGTVTQIIADRFGSPNYVNTISTACSSSANSIMLGARMIKSGQIDRVLVGGSDALCRFTINGFRSLMIYDNEVCRPFDKNRNGLNLGEGAGYLLLENTASLIESNNPIKAELIGWCNANDAYHQTGTSPDGDGAMKAMKGALEAADLLPDNIDYINAHGTATENNDKSESNAIKRIFQEAKVSFSSTKGYTGHTLGASGGIEAVFAVLSLINQCIFPNINWKTTMDYDDNEPVLDFRTNLSVNNVMSNSFGFGGNSTSLIFSKS
jgi:3-oxoacyl-(acyl-carrier-protein) synthase